MDTTIRLLLILVMMIPALGCKKQHKSEILEIRSYLVNDFPKKDSIWYDTIYADNTSKNSLKRIIHGIDSTLKSHRIDSFKIDSAEVVISGKTDTRLYSLIKYHVAYPIEYGTLSFYGIYAEDIGTVYWRWLDGNKFLKLIEKQVSNQKYDYSDLLNYLDTTILAIPPKPENQDYGEEVEGELELDTTLLN